MVTSDTPKPPQSLRTLAPGSFGHMIANMEKQDLPQVPVLVRVSAQRALGVMAKDQSWQDFAWSVNIPTDVRVLDEWDEAGVKFVVIDWSQE